MRKLTRLASLNSFGKVTFVISSLSKLPDLRKCIFFVADLLLRAINFGGIKNSFRNMMLLITINSIMKSCPDMITYQVESDDVK